MDEFVIDAKWHAERVARIRSWIKFSKTQIEWHQQGAKEEMDHLEKEKAWLAEALADQKEFLAQEVK